MNKVIKLTIPLFACLELLTISGCDQDDVTTKKDMITGIVMETQPNKTYYLKNEVLEVEGATIAVQYSQKEDVIVPVTIDMVSSVDMSTPGEKQPMVTYKKDNMEYTTSFKITVADYVDVTTEEELTQAIENASKDVAIHLKKKETPYNMHHLEIDKSLTLIGEKDATIQVDSDAISGQAGVYIKASDVSLKQLTIEMNGNTLHALKVSSNGTEKLDNILLESITMEGGKGLNLHKADTTLKDCVINVDETTKSVALSIASSNVTIEDCTIYHGSWGSIGLMHKVVDQDAPDYDEVTQMYPGNGKVTFKGDNTISGHVYIEYSEASKNTIENLGWETILQGTTLIYWNPDIEKPTA